MRGDGDFIDSARSARGCTRFDLPRVTWDVSPALLSKGGYMGRHPVPGLTEEDGRKINPKKPLERLADGCPGGWYRSRFVWSMARYLRVRLEGGHRVPNPLLNRCDDDFVLQCEQVLVREQERADKHRVEQMTK